MSGNDDAGRGPDGSASSQHSIRTDPSIGKLKEITALAAVVAAITLGGAFGARYSGFLGELGRTSPADQIQGEVKAFKNLLSVVGEEYAEPVDQGGAVFDGAIPGMLERLDPHSQFFDAQDFRRLREEQQGSYAGVGMQIRLFRGDTIVDFPFPGTPAHRAGVRPGDAIREVDGASTEDQTVEQVADAVRGLSGTSVHLGLRREGLERLVEVDLIRDSIPRPTVPLAFRLEPGIGYIKLSSFGETTADELDNALSKFSSDQLTGLVLDLRGNPGGLLSAGVHVAGRFLEEGTLVVSHRGRASRERRYYSEEGAEGEPYPMTVLVDCRSASAAEIVAGALQDHDRALIAGSSTFGKGLVQSVLRMPRSAGMVLTTARYYTPSGRLIQRAYNDVSLASYYSDPCSLDYEPARNEVRLTDAGRPVYGGGGISPDVLLAPESRDEFEQSLLNMRAFERFAQRLTSNPLPRSWDLERAEFERFQSFVQSERIDFEDRVFEDHWRFIRRRLKGAAFTAAYDLDEGERVMTELDPAVRQAVGLLSQAALLLSGPQDSELARHNDGDLQRSE